MRKPIEDKQRTALIAILVLSVLLRVGVSLYLGSTVENLPGTADQLSYHALAQRVAQGHGFTFGEPWWPATRAGAPTAHWSYLYTILLAGLYRLLGANPLAARLVQSVVVGLLQPYLAFWLARRLFDPLSGLAAAALTAGYAYFIYYAAALMTESLYITALLGGLCLALALAAPRKSDAPASFGRSLGQGVAFGLALGAAILLRQVVLLVVPFVFGWILLAARAQGRLRSALGGLAAAAAVVAALILPLTAFNYSRFGEFVLLNTNSGFAFFWANHPIQGTRFQPILESMNGDYGALIPPELSHLNEAQLDRALLGRGLQFVMDDPGRYLLLSLSRIPAYFMFWPSADSSTVSNLSRVMSFGLLWPVMLLGSLLAVRRATPAIGPPWPAGLLLLFALVYSAIHILSWALVRYRLPVDGVLLVFAGFGLRSFLGWAGRRWRPVRAGSGLPREFRAVEE
jgi:4-amino-4-deoxy-L-arabinose transferase-like glycosyltransferase